MAGSTVIRQLVPEDERMLRRWLMDRDPIFAFDPTLTQYFLARTEAFGSLALFEDTVMKAVLFFSKFSTMTHLHGISGDLQYLDELAAHLGFPAEIFIAEAQIPSDAWKKEVTLKPGQIVDHPVYETLFSRVCPRVHGSVYTHE